MDIHHGYEPWKSAPTSATNTTFGHADWHAAQSQGKSPSEIANWARANQSTMSQGPKNRPGGGGLWDQIMAAEQVARNGSGGGGGGGYTASASSPYQKYGNDIYNNPADNPYSSSYNPSQHNYMNDPSTLTPEELEYRAGNIKGLDDRQYTIENTGALLDKYIFNIKEELNNFPSEQPITQIASINNDSNNWNDGISDRLARVGPYDRYDSSNYY